MTYEEVMMTNPAAGWFKDPKNELQQRLWDGESWTQQVRAAPPEATPAPSAARATRVTNVPLVPTTSRQVASTSNFFKRHKVLTAVGVLVVGSIIGGIAAGGGNGGAPSNSAHVGIGSTVAQMTSAHGHARGVGVVCSATNSCFGNRVTNDESGKTFQFSSVLVGSGVILGYGQNFTRGTTSAEAVSQVMKFFPKDAVAGPITVSHNGGSCGLFNVTSATLAKAFIAAKQTAKGYTPGDVGVALEYTNSSFNIVYDPNNVEDAQVSPIPTTPNEAC